MDKDLFSRIVDFAAGFRELEYELERGVSTGGNSPVQFRMLQYLSFAPSQSLGQLASCMDMNLPNASREVKKLERAGYVEKKAEEGDKRRVSLALSSSGKRLVAEAFEHQRKALSKRLGTLEADRRSALLQAIGTVESILFSSEERS